jgi:hypothetical protein
MDWTGQDGHFFDFGSTNNIYYKWRFFYAEYQLSESLGYTKQLRTAVSEVEVNDQQ